MATGFVQRYKGKIALASGGMSIAGTQVNASGADFNVNTGWGTVPVTTTSTTALQLSSGRTAGAEVLAPTANVGGAIFRLPVPYAGAIKLIYYSTLNGSTIFLLTASTAGAVTFAGVGSTGSTASFAGTGGSTLSNTLKSTQSCQIELMGISTTQWLFTGVVPSTTGHLTFSTST